MKNNNSQKGFTLLETLIAIFIITLSITGPVYIASVAFHNTIDSRDNISAQYIAEEVIEVIKNKRDKKSLNGDDIVWTDLLGNNITCVSSTNEDDKKCIMKKDTELDDYVFEACDNNLCPNISFNPDGSDVVYGDSMVTDVSKFIREFYLKVDENGVKLVVNIKWDDKGRDKVYTLTERLYNMNYNQFFK